MSKLATIAWIIFLIAGREIIKWLGIESPYDLMNWLVTTALIATLWYRLGNYAELSQFLIGIGCYWVASLLDWSEVYFPFPEIVDRVDDLLFLIGFFLIGVSFLNVMLAQKQLQKRLYEQAYTDELTQLGNRRALFSHLKATLSAAKGALLYIDVDHFKSVNDQFGHDAGDLVLRECAQLLQQSRGIAYRIGGDEFVLLIENDELIYVDNIIAHLHESIKSLTDKYGISLSIGVAYFDPSINSSPDSLLAEADLQMYQAKKKYRSSLR